MKNQNNAGQLPCNIQQIEKTDKGTERMFYAFIVFCILTFIGIGAKSLNMFIICCTVADILGIITIIKHHRSGRASLF